MDTIHGTTTCHSEFALLFQLFRYGLVRWQIRQIQIYMVLTSYIWVVARIEDMFRMDMDGDIL